MSLVHIADKRARRSPKGAQRRQEILDAAVRIFGRGGYQNASIASVAEAVGLSLPGLLHHFSSKEALLLAILEERDRAGETRVGVNHPDRGDWRDQLRRIGKLNRLNMEKPDEMRLFAILNAESLLDGHPAGDWFRQRTRHVHDSFSRIFQSGLDAGDIAPRHGATILAGELIAVMDGMQMLWLRDPAQFDLGQLFDAYIERLILVLANR